MQFHIFMNALQKLNIDDFVSHRSEHFTLDTLRVYACYC